MIKKNSNPEEEKSKKEIEEIKNNFDKLYEYEEEEPQMYDSNYFLNENNYIFEAIKCPICLLISLNLIQCANCCKLFCIKCIEDYEKKNKLCPICQTELKTKKVDLVLKYIIENIPIKCQNCEKYNKKINIIKLGQFYNHISNCDYSNYRCLICKEKIEHSKKNCYIHALSCGYLDLKCCFCQKDIKKFKQKEHEEKCGNEIIPCDLCREIFKRKEIKDHKNNCKYRIIECNECLVKYIFKNGHSEIECLRNKNKNLEIENKKLKKDNEKKSKQNKNYKQIIKEELNINADELVELRSKRKVLERQNTDPNLLDNDNSELSFSDSIKKLNIMDSFFGNSIITENKDINFIFQLFKDKNFINFKRIYRMNEDQENNFHKRCDNKGPTLSIYKIQIQNNSKNINCIYGGYSSIDWDCSNKFKKDSEAFIFSVTDKKVFKAKPPYNSIVCAPNYGPSFGIKNNSNLAELYTIGRKGYYYSTDTFGDNERVCTKGQIEFYILNLEVYKISFKHI